MKNSAAINLPTHDRKKGKLKNLTPKFSALRLEKLGCGGKCQLLSLTVVLASRVVPKARPAAYLAPAGGDLRQNRLKSHEKTLK